MKKVLLSRFMINDSFNRPIPTPCSESSQPVLPRRSLESRRRPRSLARHPRTYTHTHKPVLSPDSRHEDDDVESVVAHRVGGRGRRQRRAHALKGGRS